MNVNPMRGRLRGKNIFLSASVPAPQRAERYRRVEDAHFEIEQAVISLARAVFSEGGRLVFGGHPAISPLVAMVAGEYREPRYAESGVERPIASIEVFQSRAFEGFLPSETQMMYKLGYATIIWVDAVDGETYDPKREYREPPCPLSVNAMRHAMIERTMPEAMVCIGGMDGVEKEFEIFRELRRNAPIYVLEKTGGAASRLAENQFEHVRIIDDEIMTRISELRTDTASSVPTDIFPRAEERTVVPYPLVMQTIVEELAEGAERESSRY
jgi:hypothetical protein